MDATRINDGVAVAIKRIQGGSEELDICRFFSSAELSFDPHNHCVPNYDDFPGKDGTREHFIVMPLLRKSDCPNPRNGG